MKLELNKNIYIDTVYPIGSIYLSVNSTDPAILFGGTWVRLKDKFLLGAGDTYDAGSTGGEATHKLTVDEMPSHRHETDVWYHVNGATTTANRANYASQSGSKIFTTYVGGNKAHNNMPPYLVVYMWKRTA